MHFSQETIPFQSLNFPCKNSPMLHIECDGSRSIAQRLSVHVSNISIRHQVEPDVILAFYFRISHELTSYLPLTSSSSEL
uniref:Uncharacterized protein n=1 Tax=Oryza brachyantha TaxID=4533 RepID=J3MU44_ORYBR